MLRNNYAGQTSSIGLRAMQPATVVEPQKGNWAEDLATAFSGWDKANKKNAYVDALKGGDQEQIDQTLAEYNPEAYANVLAARQKREQDLADAEVERDFKRELLDAQTNRAFALENLRNQNARSLAEFKAGQDAETKALEDAKKAETEQQSYDQAQNAINQLYDVAERNNIGVFTDWRRNHGLTGKETEKEYGRISSAVAGIAPRAIAKLKASGVSGINSLPEFMTYVGLPENPTSQQIMGALPMMAQIAGVKNPIPEKTLKNFNSGVNAPMVTEDPLGLR